MDWDSSPFDGLPSPDAHFHIFCLSQMFITFSIVHIAFELGKDLKTRVFCFCLPPPSSPDAIFNTSEVFVALSCNIMQNLMQTFLPLSNHFSYVIGVSSV
jgi:hypothetical protein